MRFRTKIVFDVDAENYSAVADYERAVVEQVEAIKTRFGNATFEFRQFKPQKVRRDLKLAVVNEQ